MGMFDTVTGGLSSAWDSVSSVAHQGYDFFANPNKWEQEHFGTVGGLAPTPSEPIKSDSPTPTMQFAYNNTEAEHEKQAGLPSAYNQDLSWEDKQLLNKSGFLNKDEKRMYGVP